MQEPGVLNIGYMFLVVNLSVTIFWNLTPGLEEFYNRTVETYCPPVCPQNGRVDFIKTSNVYNHVTLLHTSKNSNFQTKCALWSMID